MRWDFERDYVNEHTCMFFFCKIKVKYKILIQWDEITCIFLFYFQVVPLKFYYLRCIIGFYLMNECNTLSDTCTFILHDSCQNKSV